VALAAGSEDPRLFLAAPSAHAALGAPVRLALRRGDLRDGAPLHRIDERFDPFVARVGGTQHNELAPDLAGGEAGVSHAFAGPGDALVGCSTLPRAVSLRGEAVELVQHLKTLLFVSQSSRDLPAPSAALAERIGLQLELVPMIDPLPLLHGELLPMRLRFDGPGLAGAEVVVQLAPRRSPAAVVEHFRGTTDEVGAVVMPIGDPGRYLVSAEHRVPPATGNALPRVHRAVLTFDVGGKR
jgi:hypothetical protein